MTELVLYRGDSEKIHEFKFNKTFKHCLVGQGIYLTDNLKIADSYREKGSSVKKKLPLFHGHAANRLEAMEKAFKAYCETIWCEKKGYKCRPTEKEWLSFQKTCQSEWTRLIEIGAIETKYVSHPIAVGGKSGGRSSISGSASRSHQKALKTTESPCISVILGNDITIGYVSKFVFNKNYIDNNVIHVDRPCNDVEFWGLMYDAGITIGTPYADRDSYVKGNFNNKILDSSKQSRTEWNRIKNILVPYGIIGFEYNGGKHLGGGLRHRAFCIWDENFVNSHKVERIR